MPRSQTSGLYSRVSAWGRLCNEIGVGDALLYAIARLVQRSTGGHARLYKYYLVAQAVPTGNFTPVGRGRSIEVVEIDADEVMSTEFGRPASVLRHRLAHGCRCLVALKNGRLAGFQWFTLQDYPEDEVRCIFRIREADRCAWDFDVFVHPDFRLQPVFARLWDTFNMQLRRSGIEAALSRIDAFALDSRRAHARIGATQLGWAVFLKVSKAQLAVFSSRPWLHFSATNESVPAWEVSRLARRQNTTPFSD